MSNPWQQIFESHREQIEQEYIAEKYGQHKSDESQETQALYDLRNKLKNMGKDAVVAYLKRSKMSPERKARLARELGINITEEFVDAQHNSYELEGDSFEALQEEAKVLVRVTKEDGSVFQKKIPASQLDDYRKRYKTVVVVGGSEQSKTNVTAKNEEYVSEAKKKKPARWWDNDGDGIGYEPGEVSGKFKRKTKKEEYSDWRSEVPEIAEATKAQKSVEGKAHASYENQEGEKKKRKKKSAKSECSCSHEVKEAAEILAYELGGDLVDIKEYVKAATSVIKAFVRPKPIVIPQVPFIRPTKPGPIVPATPQPAPVPAPKPGKPVPAPKPEKPVPSPKPGKPTKPEPQTKPQPQPRPAINPTKTGILVKIDPKTGAITGGQTQPQTKPQTKAQLPLTTLKPPKGRGPGPGTGGRIPGGLPNLCTPIPNPLTGRLQLPPWCKTKPYLHDPVADPGRLKL